MKNTINETSGYFGSAHYDCAKIEIKNNIKSIKIFINQEKAETLTLDGIEFYSQGALISLREIDYTVRQSSTFENFEAANIISKKISQTQKEVRPYWIIDFVNPLFIDVVFIYNRWTNYRWFRGNAHICLSYVDHENLIQTVKVNKYRSIKAIANEFWVNSLAISKEDLLFIFLLLQKNNFDFQNKLYKGSKYFGSTKSSALYLHLNYKVREIEVSVEDTTLALKGMEFLYKDVVVNLDASLYSVYQSSVWKERKAENLLENKKIHTKKEKKSFWKIVFHEPYFIDSVRIYNRVDKLSSRNIKMKVRVSNEFGSEAYYSPEYDSFSPLWQMALNESTDKYFYLALIAYGIRNQVINIFSINWVELINYLDLWIEGKELDEVERVILAAYLIFKKKNGAKKLNFLAARLRTAKEINLLQDSINELSKNLGGTEYLITKHGLTTPRLINQKDKYLTSVYELIKDFKELGYDVFISYGSLLGAVREQGFIPHDDDIDFSLILKSNNIDAAKNEFSVVLNRLESLNYKIHTLVADGVQLNNVHLQKKGLKRLDIFPCFLEKDKVYLGGAVRWYEFDKSKIFPLRNILLYDQKISAPFDTDAYLVRFYGENWKVPQRFDPWPWKISDAKYDFKKSDSLALSLNMLETYLIAQLEKNNINFESYFKHDKLLVLEVELKGKMTVFDFFILSQNQVFLHSYIKENHQSYLILLSGCEGWRELGSGFYLIFNISTESALDDFISDFLKNFN